MAKIAGVKLKSVPLEYFLKFKVPIEFYDKPKEWKTGEMKAILHTVPGISKGTA